MPIWCWRNKQTWNTEPQEEAGTEKRVKVFRASNNDSKETWGNES